MGRIDEFGKRLSAEAQNIRIPNFKSMKKIKLKEEAWNANRDPLILQNLKKQ